MNEKIGKIIEKTNELTLESKADEDDWLEMFIQLLSKEIIIAGGLMIKDINASEDGTISLREIIMWQKKLGASFGIKLKELS